jgi:hypothetical protein
MTHLKGVTSFDRISMLPERERERESCCEVKWLICGVFSRFYMSLIILFLKKKVYLSSLMMKVPDHVYVLG